MKRLKSSSVVSFSSKVATKKLSKVHAVVAALIFAGIGTYALVSSFAATSTANLWVDTNGGSCVRQSTQGGYNDGQACGSFDAAYEAAQCGDTVGIKGGEYGEQTINAPEKECSSYITFTPSTGEILTMQTIRVEKGDWMKFLGGWPETNNFRMRDNGSDGSTSGIYLSPTGTGLNEWVDHFWIEGADFETFLIRGADDVTIKRNEISPGKTNWYDEIVVIEVALFG